MKRMHFEEKHAVRTNVLILKHELHTIVGHAVANLFMDEQRLILRYLYKLKQATTGTLKSRILSLKSIGPLPSVKSPLTLGCTAIYAARRATQREKQNLLKEYAGFNCLVYHMPVAIYKRATE